MKNSRKAGLIMDHNRQDKIAVINDFSGFGRVSSVM